jgi:queuosine precursor transporter
VPTNRRLPLALALATLALAPAAAALLFTLAQFGQNPPETLPLPVAVFLGLLLATPLMFMLRRLAAGERALALAVGALAALASALALAPLGYGAALGLATAAVATAAALGLLALGGVRAEMYGAISVFIVCTVLANFTLDSFLPLGGFFLVNVGTLFFGITFTQRDRVHRFGRAVVYRMIVAAALANVAAALLVGTPWRYIAVSFLAIVVSEAANTEVYQSLLHRRWFTRVAGSNAVAAPLDTIIFTTLAFAGESFATAMWMTQVIVTDVIVKYSASLVAAVTIMSRPEWLPRVPGERGATTPGASVQGASVQGAGAPSASMPGAPGPGPTSAGARAAGERRP